MTGPTQMTSFRASLAAAAVGMCLLTPASDAQTIITNETKRTQSEMAFETLTVRKEGAVLFAEIAAPPMNLLGPELVRDLVSLIKQAEVGTTDLSIDLGDRVGGGSMAKVTYYKEITALLVIDPYNDFIFIMGLIAHTYVETTVRLRLSLATKSRW